jgi:hypothetical protein
MEMLEERLLHGELYEETYLDYKTAGPGDFRWF